MFTTTKKANAALQELADIALDAEKRENDIVIKIILNRLDKIESQMNYMVGRLPPVRGGKRDG